MKNEIVLSKDFQDANKCNPLVSLTETGFALKVGAHLKKLVYIGSLAGIALFFDGCASGYVVSEPTYSEYSRPQRPHDNYIWIDNGWEYNRTNRVYVQRNGYWDQPQQNRTYVTGQWKSTPRGKYWSKGRWQKNNRKGNRHSKY
ncbi:MAG TPA: hypothetical protein DCR40_19560 [Prolixibacteraceae bacterium]|nr:hypothetical protein [Prolixibacteraceae bacterium]